MKYKTLLPPIFALLIAGCGNQPFKQKTVA